MTAYAYVENGQIIKTQSTLPKSTETVSNFYLLPEADRNAHGWYDVVDTVSEVDTITQRYSTPVFSFENGVVTRTVAVEDKTVEEVKAQLIEMGQRVAEKNVQQTYSLQEQVAALANLTTAGHKTAVVNKINTVFVAFMSFKVDVNNCTTLAQLKALWDAHPELH